MAYVDLNPIRAKLATSPEKSEYTSIRTPIVGENKENEAISRMLKRAELNHFKALIKPLMGFSDTKRNPSGGDPIVDALPIYKRDYLSLVDTTGRVVVRGKRGRIDPALEPILLRLSLSTTQWIQVSSSFRQYYRNGHLRLMRVAWPGGNTKKQVACLRANAARLNLTRCIRRTFEPAISASD